MALAEKLAWAFLAGAVLLLFVSIATIDPQNTNVKMHDLKPLENNLVALGKHVEDLQENMVFVNEVNYKNHQRIDDAIVITDRKLNNVIADVASLKTGGVFARCQGVYEHNATHFGMNCEMVE